MIERKKPLPVEVKYRNCVEKKDLKNLFSFLEKFNCKKGLLITKDLFKKEEIGEKDVLLIPAWLFLLVC